MKTLVYGSVFVLFALLSMPVTSDAFSRRTHQSEVGPTQGTNAPLNTTNVSPRSVPEPPVVMLMSIGLGAFGLCYVMMKRFRKQN